MKAIRFDRYASPDVLELRDVEVPAVGDDQSLVRVRAASVNPLDWHFMRGMRQRMVFFLAQQNKADLTVLRELIDTAKIVPVIGRIYPFAQTADANPLPRGRTRERKGRGHHMNPRARPAG